MTFLIFKSIIYKFVQDVSDYIKKMAQRHGFAYCGISEVRFLAEQEQIFEKWIGAGRHADMQYMKNNMQTRLNPGFLIENAKSVICLALNYYPAQKQHENSYKIAKYAYGTDYHVVVKSKLHALLADIKHVIPDVSGRVFVDSAPVLEKSWAQLSGLGWQGKNSCLIIKNAGSFFFLSEIIVDAQLRYDEPLHKDYCGKCRRCIDACPTQAIVEDGIVDAKKCISYITIENKTEIPAFFKGKMNDWIYGCDICQDVCPHNRFSKPHSVAEFNPHPRLVKMQKQDWENLNLETYNEIFRKSAVKRAKFAGLKRNIEFISKNQEEKGD